MKEEVTQQSFNPIKSIITQVLSLNPKATQSTIESAVDAMFVAGLPYDQAHKIVKYMATGACCSSSESDSDDEGTAKEEEGEVEKEGKEVRRETRAQIAGEMDAAMKAL